jgi:NO-binding membrane sensor protein with MHYT domain
MPTQAYEDRVVLIVLGFATAIYLGIGVVQPFWPGVVVAVIMFVAFVMLIRVRGTVPLRQSWWMTVGATAMPASIIAYALVDAWRSGMTWSHLLTIAIFTFYVAVFVVPLALARRRNRS